MWDFENDSRQFVYISKTSTEGVEESDRREIRVIDQ